MHGSLHLLAVLALVALGSTSANNYDCRGSVNLTCAELLVTSTGAAVTGTYCALAAGDLATKGATESLILSQKVSVAWRTPRTLGRLIPGRTWACRERRDQSAERDSQSHPSGPPFPWPRRAARLARCPPPARRQSLLRLTLLPPPRPPLPWRPLRGPYTRSPASCSCRVVVGRRRGRGL